MKYSKGVNEREAVEAVIDAAKAVARECPEISANWRAAKEKPTPLAELVRCLNRLRAIREDDELFGTPVPNGAA